MLLLQQRIQLLTATCPKVDHHLGYLLSHHSCQVLFFLTALLSIISYRILVVVPIPSRVSVSILPIASLFQFGWLSVLWTLVTFWIDKASLMSQSKSSRFLTHSSVWLSKYVTCRTVGHDISLPLLVKIQYDIAKESVDTWVWHSLETYHVHREGTSSGSR